MLMVRLDGFSPSGSKNEFFFYFPTKHLRIQDSVHMGMDVFHEQAQLNLCIWSGQS